MKKLLLVIFIIVLNYSLFANDPGSIFYQGINAMRMRRLSAAKENFETILNEYPNSEFAPMAKIQIANILRDSNEHEKALAMYKTILEEDPSEQNKQLAREELTNIYYDLQRFRQGVSLLEEWRKQRPDDTWISRKLAKFYLQSGQKDEAWLLLETVLERSPTAGVFQDLLDLAIKSGEVQQLINMLQNRRSSYSDAAYVDFLSDCYIALNRNDKAIETIEAAFNLRQNYKLLNKLAELQIKEKKYEDAITTLHSILRIMPYDWETLKRIGRCQVLLGDKKLAITTWRKPLEQQYNINRDFYQNYTSVLIESNMLEEALEGFYEGRKQLRIPTIFSEEIATLLYSMGRLDESREEYLKVFAGGTYSPEVFDSLYDAYLEGFDLESRLLDLNYRQNNLSVKRALLEYYFRNSNNNEIKKATSLISESAGQLDNFFLERIKQEALLFPDNFDFLLAESVLLARHSSSTALKLALLMLQMAQIDHNKAKEVFDLTASTCEKAQNADIDSYIRYLIKASDFALKDLNRAQTALKFSQKALSYDYTITTPELVISAHLARLRAYTLLGQFEEAKNAANQVEFFIEKTRLNVYNSVLAQDCKAALKYESAQLLAHSGDYQKALTELKEIVEQYPESHWLNDALNLALFITRRSIAGAADYSNFDMIEKSFEAHRLFAQEKPLEASEKLKQILDSQTASMTTLLIETTADIIFFETQYLPPNEALAQIDSFIKKYPDSHKVADLLELKWYLARQLKLSNYQLTEIMHDFIEKFPSDVRTAMFRALLARGINK